MGHLPLRYCHCSPATGRRLSSLAGSLDVSGRGGGCGAATGQPAAAVRRDRGGLRPGEDALAAIATPVGHQQGEACGVIDGDTHTVPGGFVQRPGRRREFGAVRATGAVADPRATFLRTGSEAGDARRGDWCRLGGCGRGLIGDLGLGGGEGGAGQRDARLLGAVLQRDDQRRIALAPRVAGNRGSTSQVRPARACPRRYSPRS